MAQGEMTGDRPCCCLEHGLTNVDEFGDNDKTPDGHGSVYCGLKPDADQQTLWKREIICPLCPEHGKNAD